MSTEPPPSTVAEMRRVLMDYDATRPRSQQVALGPSELGTPCQRQIAMKLAGVPRQPEPKPPWAPMQGVSIHGLMEDILAFHNGQLGRDRWGIETDLVIDADGEIPGHGDAYDGDHEMVIDWKYVGSTALAKVKRRQIPLEQLVSQEYRVQAHLYGYGHWRLGRNVKWVRLVLLARSHDYDDSREWTERYRPEIATWAVNRYYDTKALVEALPLKSNPDLWANVPAAPSDDACKWCEFNRPGPVDGTGCPGNSIARQQKALSGLIAW